MDEVNLRPMTRRFEQAEGLPWLWGVMRPFHVRGVTIIRYALPNVPSTQAAVTAAHLIGYTLRHHGVRRYPTRGDN